MKKINKNETFRNFKMAYSYAKHRKKQLFVYAGTSIVLCLISAAVPIITAKGLIYMTGGLWTQLLRAAIIVTIVEISRNAFNYLNRLFSNLFFRDTLTAIQYNVAEEILKLETKEIDNNPSGIFIDRLKKDTGDIADIFLSINDNIINIITNIGILIAIFIVSKWMFLFFIIGSALILYFKKIRLKSYFERNKLWRKLNDQNTGLINEFMRGIRDIKVLNCQNEFLGIMKQKIINSNEQHFNMNKVTRKYEFITGTITDLLAFLFIVLGIILSSNKLLSISSFVILYNYQYRVYSLIDYYFGLLENINNFNVSANRISEILNSKKFKKEKFGSKKLTSIHGDFEFNHVSFNYKRNIPVLKDVTFNIKANQTVAFVGKSGSGKTTIFNLMTKLYDIKKGIIRIDGKNIKSLNKNSLRNNISVITQNPYIFNFSIKDNLKIANPNATHKEIVEACKSASIHNFIMTLPQKYNTIVGEGGVTLSGGERQRIAIARALLKKTEIILFDEATSSLDNDTQKHITQAIDNMKNEYTILIIAHRLSTIINCDRIIFIDDGKIVAEGTHTELMKNNKDYRLLYEAEILES